MCCRNQVIALYPEHGDAIGEYDTRVVPSPTEPGRLVAILKQREDGSCIYLGETGCTIYDKRPQICRAFDCGAFYRDTPRHERKRMVREGKATQVLFDRGREIEEIRKASK